MDTVLAGGGMSPVELEGISVKLVADLVGTGGRITIVVELAGGGTTTGSEADGTELELCRETEGAGYPTVCETTVDWEAGYVT
jgi:predicted RNA methylase